MDNTITGQISAYAIQKILNSLLNGSLLGNLYLALIDPDGNELTASSYSRKPIVGYFATVSGTNVNATNSVEVLFNEAREYWGDIASWKIFTTPVENEIQQLVMQGNFDRTVTINATDNFMIPVNGISIGIETETSTSL